jgi:hypothetical protein
MRKYNITASAIVNDFNRREIKPDWTHAVLQGTLRLYRLNQDYIPELYLGADKLKPGTVIITGQSSYCNTAPPQDIADDLMAESKLTKPEIAILSMSASALGKIGGAAKTEAKQSASKENGKKGGRPKKQNNQRKLE